MKKNSIQDLRDHLFETLEELRDPDKQLDVKRAELVCNVAGRIIDSALAEVKFLQITGRDKPEGDGFFEKAEQCPVTLSAGGSSVRRLNGGDHA